MAIYIGVYLKVPLKPVPVPLKGSFCGDPECEHAGIKLRANFCPYCGTAAVPNVGNEEKMVGYQFSELGIANEDQLSVIDSSYGAEKNYEYLVPNSSEGSSIRIGESDLGEFPYPPNAEQEDRKRFQELYGVLAEKIIAEFPGTELKIGIIAYY